MAQKFLTGVQLTNGSAGSPALSFSSDTNTGIYRSGDDTVNISVGGTNRFHVNSSGIISSANVYSGGNGQFRNYSGVWKATTGVSGNGFEFTSADQTGAMTLSSNGNLKVHNNIRSQGHSTTGLSGKGMELRFFTDTDVGSILSYDRSNSTYLPIGVFGSTVSLQTNGAERLHITNAGNVGIGVTPASIGQKLRVNGNIKVGDSQKFLAGVDNDLQIQHTGTHSFITNGTGDLTIANYADDRSIYFQNDDGSGGSTTYFQLDGSNVRTTVSKPFRFSDNVELQIGNVADLIISHDSNNSTISNNTGDLIIKNRADNKDIIFQSDDGSGGVATYFYLDGSLTTVTPRTVFPDDSVLGFGTGADLQIYHDGTTSNIANHTNNLSIINHFDDGDIKFFSDDGSGGVTEYFRLDGGTERVESSKSFRFADGARVQLGSSSDMQIHHTSGTNFIEVSSGGLNIRQNADDGDIAFQSDNGSGGIATYFMLDGSAVQTKFEKNTKHIDGAEGRFGNSNDLILKHSSDNSFIENYTGKLSIRQFADDQDIEFLCDDGAGGTTEYFRLDGSATTTVFSKNTRYQDNVELRLGSGSDFKAYHSGTNSYIENNTGDLLIINYADDKDIKFYSDDGAGGTTTYFYLDGSLGINVFSKSVRFDANNNYGDNIKARFGASNDLEIYHNGTNSLIDNTVGDISIRQLANDKDIRFRCDDGSGGETDYLVLDGSDGNVKVYKQFAFLDNVKATFGGSGDLHIQHTGAEAQIFNSTGQLDIRSSTRILLTSSGGENMAKFHNDGAVELYYNNNKKLETTNTGVTITGDLEVTGTTTTVNQTNLDVSDNIIGLNRGASTNTNDSGLIIERGTTGDNAAFLWDESEDKFVFGLTTATPSATGNVTLSDYRGIKTGPITASGSITASSDITTTGHVYADTHFRSTDGNVTLSATGGGGVYLRPNGYSSTTGQVLIDASNGDATFSGGLSVNTSGSIYGTDNQTASIYMTGSGNGLSGKFGTYARNLIRSNGTNTIQIGDNTSLISLIQLKAGSSSVDGVIQLSTKNTERMRITHDGKVGVNTSSPGAKLHVVESTTNTQALRVDDGTSFVSVVPSLGSGGYTGVSSAGDIGLIFSIDGDNTTDTSNGLLIAPHTQTSGGLKILENGNVGIGVATPNTKLQVAGIIQSTEGGNSAFYGGDFVRVFNNQNFRFRNSGGTVIANIGMSGDSYFNGGNVGIGTSSPAYKLDINGGSIFLDSDWPLYLGSTNAFIEGNSSGTIVRINASAGFKVTDGGDTRLLIDTSGNVGIGTSSPGVPLDVNGVIRAVAGDANTSAYSITSNGGDLVLKAGADDVVLRTGGSGTEGIYFQDGAQDTKMFINAENGSVGVGTTSPQTNTKLDVSGAIRAGGKTSWSDRDGSPLTTTGRVVAGLTGNANGNGASAMYIFTCYGGNGYQRIVYSCRNQNGTWVVNKDIDEGVDAFDVVASTPSSGSAVTFTFKGRTSSQSYTASVFIEHMGHNLDTQYVG